MKVFEEAFFWGCSLQPSGAILHNLVSLSKKKNSLSEIETEERSGSHHPFIPTALSSAQKGQTGDKRVLWTPAATGPLLGLWGVGSQKQRGESQGRGTQHQGEKRNYLSQRRYHLIAAFRLPSYRDKVKNKEMTIYSILALGQALCLNWTIPKLPQPWA